jgi:hypothetical protein
MYTTHAKGEIAKLKTQLRATEKGFTVSIPSLEARYDVIVDDGQRLHRVQIKYCDSQKSKNAIHVDLRKECRNNGKVKLYTAIEIDAVVVYSSLTDKCYWLGAEQFNNRQSLALRFAASSNRQEKRVRLAVDFEW